MRKENQNENSKSKITRFPFREEELPGLDDETMDRFLREGFKEEADELEERLNHDPKLTGIGASDDLFQKIVEELKASGDWEEDEEKEGEEIESEEIESGEIESETAREIKSQKEIEKEALYKLLSEEDREAMEYGYREKERAQQRAQKKKRRRKHLGQAGAAMIALVTVFGVGMSSEANRRLVLQAWGAVKRNIGSNIEVDYAEGVKEYNVSEDEWLAQKNIKEELGIPSIEFMYRPQEMQYLSYEIDASADSASLFYLYQDTIFTIYMVKNNDERVFYRQIDGEVKVEEEIVTLEQGIQIKLESISSDNEMHYGADFVYKDVYYYCEGILPQEEMKKILEFFVIL